MNKENLKIKGIVTLRKYNAHDHTLIDEVINQNLIVDSGLEFILKRLMNLTDGDVVKKIGIGNGEKEVDRSDTELTPSSIQIISVGFAHETAYSDIRYISIENNKELLIESVFPEAEYVNIPIAEIGLFSENDVLIARTVLNSNQRFQKKNNEYLSVTWNIILG